METGNPLRNNSDPHTATRRQRSVGHAMQHGSRHLATSLPLIVSADGRLFVSCMGVYCAKPNAMHGLVEISTKVRFSQGRAPVT